MAVLPAVSLLMTDLPVPERGVQPSLRLIESGEASDGIDLPGDEASSSTGESAVPSLIDIVGDKDKAALENWEHLWSDLSNARAAARDVMRAQGSMDRDSRLDRAASSYLRILNRLGRPNEWTSTPITRFFRELHLGDVKQLRLQTEAVVEHALFAEPGQFFNVLNDLHAVLPQLKTLLAAVKLCYTELSELSVVSGRDENTLLPDELTPERARDRIESIGPKRKEIERVIHEACDEQDAATNIYLSTQQTRGRLRRLQHHNRARLMEIEGEITIKRQEMPIGSLTSASRELRKELRERIQQLTHEKSVLENTVYRQAARTTQIERSYEAEQDRLREISKKLDGLRAQRVALTLEARALTDMLRGSSNWTASVERMCTNLQLDLFRARLAEAYTLVGSTAQIVQRPQHYEVAESIVRELLDELYHMAEHEQYRDVQSFTQILLIEILGRQAESAHRRGDHKALSGILTSLTMVANGALMEHDDESYEHGIVVAEHVRDIATLMCRMGFEDRALAFLGGLAKARTPAIRDLLSKLDDKDLKELYADHLKKGEPERQQNIVGALVSRSEAAAKSQHHSHPLFEPLAVGGVGLASSFALQHFMSGELHAVPAALTAAGATLAIRVWNGWRSPAARTAWQTGSLAAVERGRPGTVLGSALRTAITAAGWLVPAAFASHLADPGSMSVLQQATENIHRTWTEHVPETVHHALPHIGADKYESSLSALEVLRIGTQPGPGIIENTLHPLWNEWMKVTDRLPDWKTILSWASPPAAVYAGTTMNADDAVFVYHAYMAAAGGLYGAYTLMPETRQHIRKVAGWFVPGAIALGAHAGLRLTEEESFSLDHLGRVGIGGLAMLEGIAMLFTTGTIPLPRFTVGGKTFGPETGSNVMALPFWRAFFRGLWSDTNHMALVSTAITVGISSALGGMFLHVHADKAPLLAMLGVVTTLGLFPIPLIVSGVLKHQIPLVHHSQEAWQDSAGKNILGRMWSIFSGGAYAYTSPYVWNRFWRIGTLDVPAAFLRATIGWDSFLGYAPFMLINTIFGNPTASMMRPETAGTPWQHDALSATLGRPVVEQEKLIHHWRRLAQNMSAWHFIMFLSDREEDYKDWAYPFTGIRRIWSPPSFPLLRQQHYLADFYLYVTGQTQLPHQLTPEGLRALLAEIECLAANSDHFDTIRPLVQVLYMAQAPETSGIVAKLNEDVALDESTMQLRQMIRGWFDARPWLVRHMYLNTAELHPAPADAPRRTQRKRVREAVEMSWQNYEREIALHRAQQRADRTQGLFV